MMRRVREGGPPFVPGPAGFIPLSVAFLFACGRGQAAGPRTARSAVGKTGHRVPRLASARVDDYRCPAVDPPVGFVVWRAGRAHLRRYWAETDLRKVVTSRQRPVEVCGVAGQLRWLLAATCPDGSHPFRDPVEAHGARVGAVGSGGRCGNTIIDLYRVPCPGKTYLVYMDLYECEEGRDPFGGTGSGGAQ